MNVDRNNKIRTGIIGTGLMGRRMLGSFARHSQFQTVAGFDLNATNLGTAQEEFHFAVAQSVPDLLAREDLDLVYIATPPGSHLELAKRVMERGLGLFLEKPLAAEVEQAREFVRWASAHSTPVALNFPFASQGFWEYIEARRAAGESGSPVRLEVQLHFSQWPRTWHTAGDWLSGDAEGGFLREVFSHFAYLTQRVLGPLEVHSSSVTRDAGQGETRVVADLVAGTIPVSLVGGVGGAAPDYNRWTLYCESESYALEDWSKLLWTDGSRAWEELTRGQLAATQPGDQLDRLAALVRGQDSALPSLQEGLSVLETVEDLLG